MNLEKRVNIVEWAVDMLELEVFRLGEALKASVGAQTPRGRSRQVTLRLEDVIRDARARARANYHARKRRDMR